MNTYYLKDKLIITDDFLADLETKSWQEIEILQSQIANIEANKENAGLLQLLKNLLTSYYVFAGGLENLASGDPTPSVIEIPHEVEAIAEPIIFEEPVLDEKSVAKPIDSFEPFEYFVDFEEPLGVPLTDEELYGDK